MRRYPCHDLFRDNSHHADHIRLVSEGGSSLASSRVPIGIDVVPAILNGSSEPRHSLCHNVTVACPMLSAPDCYLFSVSAELARELDQGCLPGVLRVRFEQQGVPLTDQARVQVERAERYWTIDDRDGRFSVRKRARSLIVYQQ